MANLPDEDRRRIWAHIMRQRGEVPPTIVKPELRAAVNAVDAWVDGNTASFNAALPEPFRSAATPEQKAMMLMFVVMRRAGKLRTEED